MKRTISLVIACLVVATMFIGCQSEAKPVTLVAAYDCEPSCGVWYLFDVNEYTNVRTGQVLLYSDGTYAYRDVYYEFDLFDPKGEDDTEWDMPPKHIAITTIGTYELVEDEESDGKAELTLHAAERLIYSADEVFFADSQGFYDTADPSTGEVFSSNTTFGSNPDKLLQVYGAEKVFPVNTLSMTIMQEPGDALFEQGHITFKHP